MKRFFLFFFSFTLIIVGYQNCGQEGVVKFESKVDKATIDLPLFSGTAKLDPDCQELKVYDSCIFYKNPVYQSQSVLASAQDSDLVSELRPKLNFGIRLSNQLSPTVLQNASVIVRANDRKQATRRPAVLVVLIFG